MHLGDVVILITLSFRKGLLSIGVESFSFCWNLKTMTLPASLKLIAYSAFEHSDHLQNIIYPIGKEEEFKKNDKRWNV